MATIPDAAERHVRKTIAFDGTAGNGAVGTVSVFTTTGRVHVARYSVFATEAVVDAGGVTPATLAFGVTGYDSLLSDDGVLDPADGLGLNQWWPFGATGQIGGVVGSTRNGNGWDISADVILTIANEAINNGTLVIDFWYYAITDDGALAGDDIDTGYIPVNVAQISGDATAADRLEALMDGIVPGVVGSSSTVTSVANCTGFTEATNDHFNGRLITFLTGNLAGQQCQITDYTGSTQTFTVTPLTEAPASSDTFVIH
jgi:hypothetical protein